MTRWTGPTTGGGISRAGRDSYRPTAAARGIASTSSFLVLHTEPSLAAEEELARHGAMIYDQMDWYNDRLRDLAGLENSVRTILGRKTSAFKANNRRDLIFELGEKRF